MGRVLGLVALLAFLGCAGGSAGRDASSGTGAAGGGGAAVDSFESDDAEHSPEASYSLSADGSGGTRNHGADDRPLAKDDGGRPTEPAPPPRPERHLETTMDGGGSPRPEAVAPAPTGGGKGGLGDLARHGGRGDDKPKAAPAKEADSTRTKKTDPGASAHIGEIASVGTGTGSSPGLDLAGGREGSAPPAVEPVRARPPEAPAMKAGRHDDNKQYNRFLSFLAENRPYVVLPVDVSERLVLRTVDKNGRALPNCELAVKVPGGPVVRQSVSLADGRSQFFPADAAEATQKDFAVTARCGTVERNGQLSRKGNREVELRFPDARQLPKQVPVDIAIVLDTSGSMQSQIDRLKQTLRAIHFQLTQLPTKPDVRFAMVAYRDRGDEYLTQVSGFTRAVDQFQQTLNGLWADGGGDTPEDLQAALDDAMHKLDWRTDALRLGFIVADAIPHTDYGQKFDYRAAMRESLRRGIKWTTVGAGGLGTDGEVIFRQIAQFTMGEYVFVTQGGAGDSSGGVGEASHHVGSNYSTENLDQAIVRIVRRELSYLTDDPRDFDDTIVASGKVKDTRSELIAPALAELVRQLADYSALYLKAGTPVAVVPTIGKVVSGKGDDGALNEYMTEQLLIAAARQGSFKLVERDLRAIAQEIKVQLSDLFDQTKGIELGKMIGAEALIVTKVTEVGGHLEVFGKLVRVETGEILSVSKVEIRPEGSS